MEKNVKIIAGHYGSGKSEFCMNYAIQKKAEGRSVAIADLDIVNPYFRTRQQAIVLQSKGIDIVSNNMENDWKVDIPAISSEVNSFFLDTGRLNILDVGGNAVGARVLARFADEIGKVPYDMWLVLNANRYETQTAEESVAFARDIMAMSGLKATGLINNTHMLRETELSDILRGNEVAIKAGEMLGLPVVYTVVPTRLGETCRARNDLAGEIFEIELYLRPNYL